MNPGDIEIVPGGPMEELEFDIAAGSVGLEEVNDFIEGVGGRIERYRGTRSIR